MHELEWKTRRDRINTKLTSLPSPWKIVKYSEGMDESALSCHAVEEYQTANGPADYALFVKGRLLGIIEAKKVSLGPQNVLEQAKRYSQGVLPGVGNWNGYRVPLLYSTNGELVNFLDIRDSQNISRPITNFHTPEALEELMSRDSRPDPRAMDIELPKLRPYQAESIAAVEAAIAAGKRQMLVAMATGTGKTYLTVAQIYRLLRSGAFKRILFLVDRRALAAQAVREFASFQTPFGKKFNQEYEVYSQSFKREDFEEDEKYEPNVLPNSYLTSPKPSQTFVYVTTIQRMTINLFGYENAFEQEDGDPDIEEGADTLSIPIHAFDLIIADECHRGYTAKASAIWRKVMDYFDAVKIGLTATPAPHSLSLFNEVIFRYTTEQAIEDGYLVDYDAVKIKSDVLINGVFLQEGEQVGLIDRETGVETYDELEAEREFASEEIERKITVPETIEKVIKELAVYALEHEKETGRFPKTLIFATNDLAHVSHADRVVTACKQIFARGDNFVKKITGSPTVDRPLQRIREFRNRPEPRIVVTVDMLSTGVDIPELEFIVFMRPVKSRILWVQMLGRGTRKCPDINKEKFVIFDCFNGTLIDYFRNTTDFTVESQEREAIPLAQVIENIYQNIDREYYTKVLIKRLHRVDRTMSGDARKDFEAYIPDGDVGRYAEELRVNLKKDFAGMMATLRDPKFQSLLLDYKRARPTFVIAREAHDDVTSEVLFRKGDQYLKPEDYLEAFTRYVKENPDQIDAIKILLNRPKDWSTQALADLRIKLQKNAFPEKELQRAHKVAYNKALVDIISMVKHAARTEEPIMNAEERVDRALNKLKADRDFSSEQLLWLGYIREHMITNLTIDLADFDLLPVFDQRGGIKTAEKVFGKDLPDIVRAINQQVAA